MGSPKSSLSVLLHAQLLINAKYLSVVLAQVEQMTVISV